MNRISAKTIGLVALGVACVIAGAGTPACGAGAADRASSGLGGAGNGEGGGLALGGGGSCAGPHCDDPHTVVDCDGNVLETCPDDKGCSSAACELDPCAAADATKSSIGCAYYVHNPTTDLGPGCHAIFVVNTWTKPTTLTADAGGAPAIDLMKYAYIPSGKGRNLELTSIGAGAALAPNQIAVVFMRDGVQDLKCPKPAAESDPGLAAWTDSEAGESNLGTVAVRVRSSLPIVMFDIQPFGGGKSRISDGALLLPTSTWDTNYLAITPGPFGPNSGAPATVVIASEDDTQVTILPTATISGGTGLAGSPANKPVTYPLFAGGVLRLEQTSDLQGSVISANKPVGVWGETGCFSIGSVDYCDAAHEQVPPIRSLGHEYAVVHYRDRVEGKAESPPVKIVGAVDGTELTWTPEPSGAAKTIGRGETLEVHAKDPFVVKSQDGDHPFYVVQYMTGAGPYDDSGDPEFLIAVPSAQYPKSYTFFTDPTYPETDLVFVRKRDERGFAEVELDCRGVLTGWQPFGSNDDYEYVRIDLSRFDFQGQHGCDNGVHRAASLAPFGLTVWGWGTPITGSLGSKTYSGEVSYAYQAGANMALVNAVSVAPVPR